MSLENGKAIPLNGKITGGVGIVFLRAELSTKYDLPFALIRYSVDGTEPEDGLRLDLDKQVFLDRPFADEEREKVLDRAAEEIVEFLGSVLD